jgi:hypothetical protein
MIAGCRVSGLGLEYCYFCRKKTNGDHELQLRLHVGSVR